MVPATDDQGLVARSHLLPCDEAVALVGSECQHILSTRPPRVQTIGARGWRAIHGRAKLASVTSNQPGPTHRLRAIANWVNLSTPLGLAIATAGGASIRKGPQRLFIGEGYRWRFPKAGAFTVGSVVIVPNGTLDALIARFPDVLEHEHAHARQWALCLGLPFAPLYLLATGWSQLRTGTTHGANVFEVHANLHKGGYQPAETRRLRKRKA